MIISVHYFSDYRHNSGLFYNFNPASGNLTWRQNNKISNLKEDFTYDNLDRLDNVRIGITDSHLLDSNRIVENDYHRWDVFELESKMSMKFLIGINYE